MNEWPNAPPAGRLTTAKRLLFVVAGIAIFAFAPAPLAASTVSINDAAIVVRPGILPNAEKTAARILVEEIEKRTGIRLPVTTTWPAHRTAIAIASQASVPGWPAAILELAERELGSKRAEAYRLRVQRLPDRTLAISIAGADARGTLYGVGQLLRRIDWKRGSVSVDDTLDIATAPAYAIRGHQLGYRAQANSYDALTIAQFEQYIRELTFFGVNSIEGIPFQDDRPTPVMKVPRREMNRAIGDICDRYGLDYWVWVPAEFDLKETGRRTALLDRFSEFSQDTKQLTAVFFPGGDPGNNPPELVLPFLQDLAARMRPAHPQAKIWLSLQWFTPKQVDMVYGYLEREQPSWFGGLVAGPSGPPIAETRRRLPKRYPLRLYPDITHNKLCQYEVPDWDQAYALTLGREAINPRPAEFALIHNRVSPYSDGFISYSDGVHDDVNKTIWSALSWDPQTPVRDILTDYARVYFQPRVAEGAADGILALERNWRGPLVDNGAVEGTLRLWQSLEKTAPELEKNWRWQMCLLRAVYDAYDRRRAIFEGKLENEANGILLTAAGRGSSSAMAAAGTVLARAANNPQTPELRARIIGLCQELFESIGLQSSVQRYHAINPERGAVLDFIDLPLNNRWWLEDEFRKIGALPSEVEKVRRLKTIARWEDPGPGSFYDDIGNIAKSPHVVRMDIEGAAPGLIAERMPTFWWLDQGKSRARLSWQTTMWPREMVYEGLDPSATYIVRSSGYGQALLRVNGQRVQPTTDGRAMGDIKEFPVPAASVANSKIILTWDAPEGEEHLNWRQKSRLAEVWLIRAP